MRLTDKFHKLTTKMSYNGSSALSWDNLEYVIICVILWRARIGGSRREKQDILLRKFLLLKESNIIPARPTTTFSRYFSITIIAANITNPFQILLKWFWVLFSFYLYQSKWSLLIFTDFISWENKIVQKENICWNGQKIFADSLIQHEILWGSKSTKKLSAQTL